MVRRVTNLLLFLVVLITSAENSLSTQLHDVICPDQSSSCPDDTTCCQLDSGKYGCCPMPNAVCCSDKLHCCPEATRCDLSRETCIKSDGTSINWALKTLPEQKLRATLTENAIADNSLVCPDQQSKCPDGFTCCLMPDGHYGCCPQPNAVCCSDRLHCCPHGTKCDLAGGTCVQHDGIIRGSWYRKRPAEILPLVFRPRSITSRRRLSEIPQTVIFELKTKPCDVNADEFSAFSSRLEINCHEQTTCCGSGCCAFERATCCEDNLHCCPAGTVCNNRTGTCEVGNGVHLRWQDLDMKVPRPKSFSIKNHGSPESSSQSLEQVTETNSTERFLISNGYQRQAAVNVAQKNLQVLCDGEQHVCPQHTKCCQKSNGEYGCCIYELGTCCKNNEGTCCPKGWACAEGGRCTRDNVNIDFLRLIRGEIDANPQ